jgi:hypothetical protein
LLLKEGHDFSALADSRKEFRWVEAAILFGQRD